MCLTNAIIHLAPRLANCLVSVLLESVNPCKNTCTLVSLYPTVTVTITLNQKQILGIFNA